MRLLLTLCALLLARGAPAPWPLCPTDALPAASARRAAAAGDAALARACWAAAAARGGGGAARALRGVQEAQLALLEAQAAGAPADPRFPATFWELMALMEKKSILTLPELDALAHRFDVYLLHGQLACLEEAGGGAAGAVRSLALALALRESPAIRRLLARVALGRGQPRAALASATAARRGGAREAPADAAAALLLQFQALALWARRGEAPSGSASQAAAAAVRADSGGQAAAAAVAVVAGGLAEDAGPAPSAELAEEVWEEVRELIGGRFRALGVALPPGDPLRLDAPPPFLALPPPGSASNSSSGALALGGDAQRWLALATPAAAREWGAQGYTVLRGVLPPAYLRALRLRHEQLFYGGEGGGGGVRVEPDAAQRRHMLWDEELSLYAGTRLLPAVDAIVGARTSSTYTASIAYARGGDLKPHVDREANAFSLSVNLGLVGAEGGGGGGGAGGAPWPLHVCPRGVAGAGAACAGVELAPGDGLLYGGPRHTHYREPLAGAEGSLHVVFGFRDMHEAHCNSQ
jgi:hypothetical protein